jgi:hypothetical protein
MEKWKYKILLIYLICGIVILYPFMAIKYFETISPNVIALTYFTPFIVLTTIILGPIFYFKKVIPVDHDLKRQKKSGIISKRKEKVRHFFSIFMMIIWTNIILYGLTFSLIVTTNMLLEPIVVQVNEPILNYQYSLSKNGKKSHYIKIKHPTKNEIIELRVYQDYNEGELFTKEMKIGKWGILYSEK